LGGALRLGGKSERYRVNLTIENLSHNRARAAIGLRLGLALAALRSRFPAAIRPIPMLTGL
jgi:hypothetical protein